MRSLLLSILLSAATVSTAEDAATPSAEARVKGDRVNLRGRPDANGEVVGQAMAGDALKIVQAGETWIGVAPPPTIKCWVHKDFIRDGVVNVKELTVRAGASINYPRIGSLNRGEAITPRETFGEWICVNPPTNAVVWVHRDLLDLGNAAAAPVPTPAITAPDTPASPEAAPALPVTTNRMRMIIRPSAPENTTDTNAPVQHDGIAMPPRFTTFAATDTNAFTQPPADLKLIPLQGQGIIMRHEGIVKNSAYDDAPARHRLVIKKGDLLETLCYLRGNKAQLASLVDQRLMMQGREYWVQGVAEPVLVVERIERRDDPDEAKPKDQP